MKVFIPLLFIASMLTVSSIQGQHTERFLALTKPIKAKKSVEFENHFTDGGIKNVGTSLTYKMSRNTYYKTTGTYRTYYKTGELKSESELDRFGNVLHAIYYNTDGSTWWKSNTISIDSDLLNYRDYFRSTDHLSITNEIKEYKFSEELDGMYLKAEGITVDGAKQGTWRFYDPLGRLEEEVEFN